MSRETITSSKSQTSVIERLTKHLPILEKSLLIAAAMGFVLTYLQIDPNILRFSLLGLAITYFLFAYRPIEISQRDENEQFGFSELLGQAILPKVLWISSAIVTLGIAFHHFDLGNDGYQRIMMIGSVSILISVLIIGILKITGTRNLSFAVAVLLRAIPLLLVAWYLLVI